MYLKSEKVVKSKILFSLVKKELRNMMRNNMRLLKIL